jgi:cytidine deaminase
MEREIDWHILLNNAWDIRERAFILGKTKVGAAVLTNTFQIFVGCNVENTYRNHDVHAEVNAITNMITNGETKMIAIAIVAERQNFSPCGSCLDWIFQFGGKDCLIGWQSDRNGKANIFTAKELMPHYPF